MKLAALISGGKDSSFAIYRALQEGHTVTDLVTIKPESEDSYMFHSANIHLTDLISQACGIPLTSRTSSGEKEKELDDLKDALRSLKVDGVAVGAIESEYQASRVRRICSELGLKMYAPLWHMEPIGLLGEMIKCMDIRIVKVAAAGMDESWLGRRFDETMLEDLKSLNRRYRVHIMGEGGEYETLVLDAPYYRKRINLLETGNIWMGDHGVMRVIKAELVEKD
ncbi:metal-binding-domain/4Fe-4S-binding-domain containing ABC transporter, ATP-binding protein [Candidatus Methanoperedens nitroreducens]|uniref:Metal-binding-domain/4Fe-4S-binding-domain containing ABC transporter, ATP-binding protein n=1 Tax=Candidatus Methanoperedens nitratireducens TaxID=1392998 RepID=A0A062UUF7_9EURY|nr:diphthine--ammonia ligase [Candidatus Methanoperedens nitroreducens]KCZ70666.1 metal-binding-domain/4Fe-4S-binding-domain containing ABC transporter, ATP-binding protein [Candidatus Methanoperedens nitroreducens]MDJ1420518.1 TIGR00289 family protein [Candidatus Methanoperedens sp.]